MRSWIRSWLRWPTPVLKLRPWNSSTSIADYCQRYYTITIAACPFIENVTLVFFLLLQLIGSTLTYVAILCQASSSAHSAFKWNFNRVYFLFSGAEGRKGALLYIESKCWRNFVKNSSLVFHNCPVDKRASRLFDLVILTYRISVSCEETSPLLSRRWSAYIVLDADTLNPHTLKRKRIGWILLMLSSARIGYT